MNDKQINKDENLIAHCGLYCGACPSFISGKCDGCRGNSAKSAIVYKQGKVKPCCVDNGFLPAPIVRYTFQQRSVYFYFLLLPARHESAFFGHSNTQLRH